MYKLKFVIVLILTFNTFSFLSYAKPKEEKPQYDPTRSPKAVQEAMVKLLPDIKTALTSLGTIYAGKEAVSLKFYISPSGKVSFMGFMQQVALDSTAQIGLKKALYRQLMDTVQQVETITKVVVQSMLDKNKEIVLSEKMSVEYIEIRSKSGILLVFDMNSRSLRQAYSKRWAQNQSLQGRVTLKLGIDDKGDVVTCLMVESTMNDPVFEKTVVKEVSSWKFGQINNPGDVTEIIYPFIFNQ